MYHVSVIVKAIFCFIFLLIWSSMYHVSEILQTRTIISFELLKSYFDQVMYHVSDIAEAVFCFIFLLIWSSMYHVSVILQTRLNISFDISKVVFS